MRNVRVEDLPDGGVRIVACDWPWAGWFALLTGLPALALLVWSVAGSHWVECGGAVVFCAAAATSGGLFLAKRRWVELRGGELVAREGAGPFARDVRHALDAPPRFEVEAFPTPDGAPELSDRGGDLLLVSGALRYPLARLVGPGWRVLEDLRSELSRQVHG